MSTTTRNTGATSASLQSGGSRLQNIGLLVLATGIWGAMFPISKHLLANMDPISMTLMRYGIAAPIFLALLVAREGRASLSLDGRGWRLLGLGTLGFAGFNLLMFYGVGLSKPEHGAVVMALQPLIASLIAWARTGNRPALKTYVSLLVAIPGVALLVTNGNLAGLAAHASLLPILMMIAGGTSWVLYSAGAARFPGWSPLRYTALSASAGVLSLIVLWLLVGAAGGLRLPSAAALPDLLPAMAYVTVFAAFLAVLAWNAGVRGLGVQNGVLFVNVVPLTALIVGIVMGKHFGGWELVGAAMVLSSLFITQYRGRTQPAAREAAPAQSLRPAAVKTC
ncbi:DMT family transporter [Niveibacterium sp. SC-1]|uniref:DMT family transporter n=1 Tax=Niveibacterium sp. SC-1 TaxID=3135646 RepID=UPI00311F7F18